MDPLGFAFENFDAIGAWRDQGRRVRRSTRRARCPTARRSRGPAELKAILKGKKDLFSRCLTEKMLTYALGRGLEYYDKPAVDGIVAALAEERLRVLHPGGRDRQERSRSACDEERNEPNERALISRRTVLQGLGAAVALPWLEAMGPLPAWARPPRRPAGRRRIAWRSSTSPTA